MAASAASTAHHRAGLLSGAARKRRRPGQTLAQEKHARRWPEHSGHLRGSATTTRRGAMRDMPAHKQIAYEHAQREPGPGGPPVSDVSRVSRLRKRVGRASAAMKMIGLISAVTVAAYSYGVIQGTSVLYLGALVFAVAF